MMRRAAIYSALLHVTVALLTLIGLPVLFDPEPLVVRAITVEVVNIADETAAPKISPQPTPPDPEPEPEKVANLPPPEPPKIAPPPAPEPAPAKTEAPPAIETPKPSPEAVPPPEPRKVEKPKVEPEEKKPESVTKPPQTTPKLKPRVKLAEKKERKTTDFQSVLKTVADIEEKRPQETDEKSEKAEKQPRQQTASAFARQLTVSELDAIRSQIERCWNVPIGAREAGDLVVEVNVDMNPDGTVQRARLIDRNGRYGSDSFYRAAADSAMRAVLNPRCSPLRLPPDKYETWKNFTLNFNPRDML